RGVGVDAHAYALEHLLAVFVRRIFEEIGVIREVDVHRGAGGAFTVVTARAARLEHGLDLAPQRGVVSARFPIALVDGRFVVVLALVGLSFVVGAVVILVVIVGGGRLGIAAARARSAVAIRLRRAF